MDWNIIDKAKLPSPCYIIDCDALEHNLMRIADISKKLNTKILFSVKGFIVPQIYSLISKYLQGSSVTSLFEAKLAHDYIGKETHIHAPAYFDKDIVEITQICDHMVFNSFSQWNRYKEITNTVRDLSCAIRINPNYSEVEQDIYNPCTPNSRFGESAHRLEGTNLSGLSGLHFHSMCDQGSDVQERTIQKVIDSFGDYLGQFSWINLGGGQRLTDNNYDVELISRVIQTLQQNYGLATYMEPCETVVADCGYLYSSVLDIVVNGKKTVILDSSALCHLPGVLEMPYTPDIICRENGGNHEYCIAGATCYAGDMFGTYTFQAPIRIGEHIIFDDVAAYTMVKSTMFNGINLPSIVLYSQANGPQVAKAFNYNDFISRYREET